MERLPRCRERSFVDLRYREVTAGNPVTELLKHAGILRWLQAPMAAPRTGYFYPELAEHPVVVTNLRGAYTDHVATHAVSILLTLARNLHLYLRQQTEHRWDGHYNPSAIPHLQTATIVAHRVLELRFSALPEASII